MDPALTAAAIGVGGTVIVAWPVSRLLFGPRSGPSRKLARAGSGTSAPSLPDGFRYHDLRHYFASLLIASGADVKTVHARLRHASAKTTLDCYGHLWPDRDESTRAAVDVVLAARAEQIRNGAGTR